jgi:hypothetical protein
MPHFVRTQGLAGAAVGVLPAWLVGVLVMLRLGAPTTMPVMNAAAVVLGMLVVVLAGPSLGQQLHAHAGRLGVVIVLLLALPFSFEPLSGVHRWITVGPVRLHSSSIVAPLALLCLVGLLRSQRFVAAVLLLASIELVHIGQPDAGQATAISAGAIVAMLRARLPPHRLLLGVAIATGGALMAWSRPDPLEPVALVEDMLWQAFALGLPFGIAGVVGLAALPAAALLQLRTRPSRCWTDASFVLAAYFAATVLVTFIGHFPTPVLGHGASPIIGAILGLALVWGASREEVTPARRHGQGGGSSPSQ